MEYVVFYRDQETMALSKGYWYRSPRYCQNSEDKALKYYARRVKEYGMKNVIFAKVEVLYDGKSENSQ